MKVSEKMRILLKDIPMVRMVSEEEGVITSNIGIENGVISFIGEVPEDFTPEKVFEGDKYFAMPGMINTHTHMAMSHFRNYADDLPLMEWLEQKIWPMEAKLDADHVYYGTMVSIIESIQSGCTCFNDMYFFMDEVAKATEESGIRACLARGIVGFGDEEFAKLRESVDFCEKWQGKANGRITTAMSPHAPYTCNEAYLKAIRDESARLNVPLHIHLSETKGEVNDSLKAHGRTPIEYVETLGVFERPTMAAHCVHLYDQDFKILKRQNISVLTNPSSNLKLGSGIAPVQRLLDEGINVALGTDGSSSNNNVNMLEELHLLSLLQKGINNDPTAVNAYKALEIATINGAKALCIDKEVGSLEVGKKADIVLFDTEKAHWYPKHNLLSAVVYSAQAEDVDTVIIDGQIIMEERDIKTVNVKEVLDKFNSECQRLINA